MGIDPGKTDLTLIVFSQKLHSVGHMRAFLKLRLASLFFNEEQKPGFWGIFVSLVDENLLIKDVIHFYWLNFEG